jgi:hypothetical protein
MLEESFPNYVISIYLSQQLNRSWLISDNNTIFIQYTS